MCEYLDDNPDELYEAFRLALVQILKGPPKREQKRVARAANLAPSTFNQILKGTRKGPEEQRRTIAKHLGWKYDAMLKLGCSLLHPAPEAEEDIPEICEKQLALLAQSMPNEQASARINQVAHDYRQSLIKMGFVSAAVHARDMVGKGADFRVPMLESPHVEVVDLLALAAEILMSGNQTAVDALARNIQHFAQAIEVEKRLEATKARLKVVEEELSRLKAARSQNKNVPNARPDPEEESRERKPM